MIECNERNDYLKYIYKNNEKVKNYVDAYVNTRKSGRCRKPITVEEALKHKLVREQIVCYLNHDEKDVGQYPDKHDYN